MEETKYKTKGSLKAQINPDSRLLKLPRTYIKAFRISQYLHQETIVRKLMRL